MLTLRQPSPWARRPGGSPGASISRPPRHARKRAINLKDHGLDFVDAPRVFEGATYTFEDDRFDYGEQRYETLGLLAGVPVSIVTRRPKMKSASSPFSQSHEA
jgi:uncharacterized DUF497 family protein